MQFMLPRETNMQLDAAIKERPDLVTTIFREYAAASNGMDETNSKNVLVDILATHYKQLTRKEN